MAKTVRLTQPKQSVETKVGLQLRVLYRDHTGKISDVTQDDDLDIGLKDLQHCSSSAHSGLMRTKELLELLALAAENREQVDAALVRRVCEELQLELSPGGDLEHYVSHTEQLFEEAVAMPFISGIVPSPWTLKAAS